jgi:GxxExxY protein
MSELRYQDLTYQLRGLVFDVRKRLKTGWPEEVYHQGMVQLAQEHGIPIQSKPRKTIHHRNIEIHTFECDLITWELIILELKVLPSTTFAPSNYTQLIHYLKCWGKNLGLLVNFGPTRAHIERVVWDDPALEIIEDYQAIKTALTQHDKELLRPIRQTIHNLAHQYGLGFPETMYRNALAVELNHTGLSCTADVEITPKWGQHILARHISNQLLIEGNYLLAVRSLLERPSTYDFAQLKTFLRTLDLKIGLMVNFGKKQLQIYGVNVE